MDEWSDLRGIVDSVTRPVVLAGVVDFTRVGDQVLDKLALPSVDHITLSVSGHQATEHVILDEPVERGHNLVDCVLAAADAAAGETPHLCGSPDILIIVVVIVGGVVEVELLGVVSVSNAKVAVFVIRKVAYLP